MGARLARLDTPILTGGRLFARKTETAKIILGGYVSQQQAGATEGALDLAACRYWRAEQYQLRLSIPSIRADHT